MSSTTGDSAAPARCSTESAAHGSAWYQQAKILVEGALVPLLLSGLTKDEVTET